MEINFEREMIKAIDLLNRIIKDDQIPKYIVYDNYLYEFDEKVRDYYSTALNDWLFEFVLRSGFVKNLNEELEIIKGE